jgi:hypothetical protein
LYGERVGNRDMVDTTSPEWKAEISRRLRREERGFRIFWGVVIAAAVVFLLWGVRAGDPSDQFPACAQSSAPCRSGNWIIGRDGSRTHVDDFNAFDIEGQPGPYMRPG